MAADRQGRPPLTPAQLAALEKGRAHRFKPGQSGNPRGPKKGLADLRALLDAAMARRREGQSRKRLDEMVESLADKLAKADPGALELVLRRVWPVPLDVTFSGTLSVSDDDRADLDRAITAGLSEYGAAPLANGHDSHGANGVDRVTHRPPEGGTA